MPHVVLTGTLDLEAVFKCLEKFTDRDGSHILRTGPAYLERDGGGILQEATVIEDKKSLNFLLFITKRDDGIVVRLHSFVGVEKTDGVKRLLALVAKRILVAFPAAAIGTTNLQDYL